MGFSDNVPLANRGSFLVSNKNKTKDCSRRPFFFFLSCCWMKHFSQCRVVFVYNIFGSMIYFLSFFAIVFTSSSRGKVFRDEGRGACKKNDKLPFFLHCLSVSNTQMWVCNQRRAFDLGGLYLSLYSPPCRWKASPPPVSFISIQDEKDISFFFLKAAASFILCGFCNFSFFLTIERSV